MFGANEELDKLGNLIYRLTEALYIKFSDPRSIDLGHEILQILAKSLEIKPIQRRKTNTRCFRSHESLICEKIQEK